MASRCVEASEGFILRNYETQVRTKTKKEAGTTGLTFSDNGQRREEKMSNLKATKYKSLTKRSLNFFAELRTENEKCCLDNFALYVINK